MPLVRKDQLRSSGVLGIWHITESSSYFENLLDLSTRETLFQQALKGRRRTEWLASRWLVHLLSERLQRGEVIKDQYGKPHLSGSDWHISLSHTQDHTAVIASERPVGIDIQVRVSKITRIAHKFINDQEAKQIDSEQLIDQLHIYWGIKESLYKAFGRRAIDYKKHLHVQPPDFLSNRTEARITGRCEMAFDAYFELNPAYILTYVVEKTL